MPLSIAVQKDIGEYTEKLVFGLSARQLIALGAGVGATIAEGVIGCAVMGHELEDIFLVMCLTLTAAFLLGFIRPYGLKFSLAARLYVAQWVGAVRLIYKSTVYMHDGQSERKQGVKEYRYFKRACKKSRCPEVDIPRIATGEFCSAIRPVSKGHAEALRLRAARHQEGEPLTQARDARRRREDREEPHGEVRPRASAKVARQERVRLHRVHQDVRGRDM